MRGLIIPRMVINMDESRLRTIEQIELRIPVNVTADSGNVTGIPANVTEGRCCAF